MSYGIIGLGRFGTALATTLAQAGKEIMVLDRDEEKVKKQMRLLTEHAYVVRNLQKETLGGAGNPELRSGDRLRGNSGGCGILTTPECDDSRRSHVISRPPAPSRARFWRKSGQRWCIRSGIWRFVWQSVLISRSVQSF